MKLTVLVDNNTFIDQYLKGEAGLSFYIESQGKKILFDCGYSDLFISNATKLGIDLFDLDYIVLSHNHQDHTWGLNYLIEYYSSVIMLNRKVKRPTLVAHPEIFRSTFIKDVGEIGMIISQKKLANFLDIKLSAEPFSLSKELIFLGEVPRVNNYENQDAIGMDKMSGKPDFMLDDTALALKTGDGIFVITGCSHAGICNICEYAKTVCAHEKILSVIGGTHLLEPAEEQLTNTLQYFRALNLDSLYACHCTDLASKLELAKVAPLKEVGCGLVLEF